MFLEFFYYLRNCGMQVSTQKWLDLLQALKLGLHGSTMKGFYFLCRCILCKSEEEYDLLDEGFARFFRMHISMQAVMCGRKFLSR